MKILVLCFLLLSTSFAENIHDYDNFIAFIKENNFKSLTDYAVHSGFSNFEKLFLEYKLNFNKIYNTKEEEELRKFNFLNSLKDISENKLKYLNGDVLHELAVNHFSDLSEIEYGLMLNGSPLDFNSEFVEEQIQEAEKLPENFDWREKGCVTPIKNQGSCGSCWAFATIAAIESAYAIKNNVSLDLSEQELVDCSSTGKYHSQGCHYGFNDEAFQYVIDNGVVEEKDYPYLYKQDQCPVSVMKSSHKKWFIKNYKVLRFNTTDEEIMSTIYNKGPVTVQINADGNDFKQYHRGIITGGPKGYPIMYNHIVTVIGWGIENNTNYWIIKNSWSQRWGENGFARLKREVNIRSMNDFVVYPIL